MKKKLICLLILCLLCGCTPQLPFNTFIDEVTHLFLEGTTSFNLNYLYNDSIYDGKYFGLGFVSKEEYDEMMDQYEDIKKDLSSYRYVSLSDEEKIIYDALDDYLSRQLALKDYYYYDNDYFGSYSSLVQELPLLLQMYTFNDQEDLNNYLKNIKAFKNDFLEAIAFEKKRQELQLGYSKEILEDTISQIEDILDENGEELIKEVNHTIANLPFLTNDEIKTYQDLNVIAIKEDLMGAYQILLQGLKEIEGKKENISIHDKAYYEAIIYQQLGIKKKINAIEKDLIEDYDKYTRTLYSLISMNPEILEVDNIYAIEYSEFEDASSGLDYLKGAIQDIVPSIDQLEYTIYTVPESLQEGFAPAAYLSPKIDMKESQKESILINPLGSQENIFPTLVHEGYPGHMYQHTYLRNKNYPDIMYLIDCIGYSEGWAIYMEHRASEFLKDNVMWQKILITNEQVNSCLLALMDIQIHYKGWSYQECIDFFNDYTGNTYTTELQDLYNIILQTPGYYLYYIYAGEIFHDLYEEAYTKLGNKFNETDFHRIILECGNVGLDLVSKNIKQYIKIMK